MPELHKAVVGYVRSHALIRAGDRVCVAVSGGADSVALLRLLLDLRSELGIVLSVAHVNHNLRGADSDADAAFVAALAAEHGLEMHPGSEDVRSYSGKHSVSLEAAGRRLRDQFFADLVSDGHATRVATAHTADDQAETVLLRLLRGTGPRGLAGILPSRDTGVAQAPSPVRSPFRSEYAGGSPASTRASIIRPLLSTRRSQLRDYLRDIAQPWREDASNSDLTFARNRVRAELLPLLVRSYNPSLVDTLAATAEIARAEEEFWDIELARLLPAVLTPAGRLRLPEFGRERLATQRRLVRLAAGALDFELVEQVLDFARRRGRRERSLPLPGGRVARFTAGELWFETASSGAGPALSTGYHYRLPVPGDVCVRELNRRIKASLLPLQAAAQGYNPQQFLDPSSLASELSVRNWRAGDRFWPLHGKAPRKLKELLPKVPAHERSVWPVVVSGDEIVWVRGLAVAHDRSAKRAKEVVVIEETQA